MGLLLASNVSSLGIGLIFANVGLGAAVLGIGLGLLYLVTVSDD